MDDNQQIKVENVIPLTPHNKAIYEAGKALIIESITVSREFCKFMITLATSAIPIHLGLLKFVLPEHYALTSEQAFYATAPALLFLVSAIIFTIGYYPQTGNLSLDIIAEIEIERSKTLTIRKKKTFLGFVVFCIASLTMIICVAYYLKTTMPE